MKNNSSEIWVINGPNLSHLHLRDQQHYGKNGLKELENWVQKEWKQNSLADRYKLKWMSSDGEHEIVQLIHGAINSQNVIGIVINPGAFSHYSIAIHDALEMYKGHKVEVHLSFIHKRETFRQQVLTALACDGIIEGFKEYGYFLGIMACATQNEQNS